MLYVIGIGPGHPDYLLPAAVRAAEKCQVLVGGSRALDLFSGENWKKFLVSGDLVGLRSYLQDRLSEGKAVAVLVSGDPGFYSLLPFIKKSFPAELIEVIPGISSLQMAFARASIPWQSANLISVHGRRLEEINPEPGTVLGLLTGNDNTPQRVADYLLAKGPNRRVFLGDSLSYIQETWLETDLSRLTVDDTDYNNAVVIVMPAEED